MITEDVHGSLTARAGSIVGEHPHAKAVLIIALLIIGYVKIGNAHRYITIEFPFSSPGVSQDGLCMVATGLYCGMKCD